MTQSEQRLARVVLDMQATLASFTAAELASLAQVSNATAARFFQRLGYSSFGEARRQARDFRPIPVGTPCDPEPSKPESALVRHVERDRAELARAAGAVSESDLQAASGLLAGAETVWVGGFGAGAPLAALAHARLLAAKPDVRLLQGPYLAEDLAGLRPGQAMLLLDLRGETPLDAVLTLARRAGVPRVLLSADQVRTVRTQGDVTLAYYPSGIGPLENDAAPVSLIAHLANTVRAALGQAASDRLNTIQDVRRQLEARNRHRRPVLG